VARARGRQAVKRMAIVEFSLDELLDDPMVGLVMRRDGVDRRAFKRLFDPTSTVSEGSAPASD
jgi:hypothetical protein